MGENDKEIRLGKGSDNEKKEYGIRREEISGHDVGKKLRKRWEEELQCKGMWGQVEEE